jgi:hypothetical protein
MGALVRPAVGAENPHQVGVPGAGGRCGADLGALVAGAGHTLRQHGPAQDERTKGGVVEK